MGPIDNFSLATGMYTSILVDVVTMFDFGLEMLLRIKMFS